MGETTNNVTLDLLHKPDTNKNLHIQISKQPIKSQSFFSGGLHKHLAHTPCPRHPLQILVQKSSTSPNQSSAGATTVAHLVKPRPLPPPSPNSKNSSADLNRRSRRKSSSGRRRPGPFDCDQFLLPPLPLTISSRKSAADWHCNRPTASCELHSCERTVVAVAERLISAD